MDKTYDLTIIGAGPGGYVSAIKAAKEGLRVCLIEEKEVGGTCLNRGCIPTKTLMHSANLYRELLYCSDLGIHADGIHYNIQELYARKEDVITQLRSGIEALIQANQIDLIYGSGKVAGAGKVLVNEQSIVSDHILLAAGSIPFLPPIDGIDLPGVITSNELLSSGEDIKKLVIIGGGVIGVEFAEIFHSLGCEVTIIEAMGRIVPNMDREISQNLAMIMKKRGISVLCSSKVIKIEQNGQLTCKFSNKEQEQEITADRILVATGRYANTKALFCEGFHVEMERGAIVVDGHFETSVKGIYAIGDLVHGSIQLAHAASAEGMNAVMHICEKEPTTNISHIPSCIYTSPEIACVGLTADEAKTSGITIKTGKFIMSANGKTVIEQQDRGFIKLVFDAEHDILLGAQLMCARATDLISELTTAIVHGLTAPELAEVVRPHPTFCEAVTEAVEDAYGMAIHTMPARKR